MNSAIPTSSARKWAPSQPKSVAPSTIRKPSAIPGLRGPLSTQKSSAMLSGVKRPADYALSSHTKFKRTTPLSLARNKTAVKPAAAEQVVTRLQFNDNFKTPISNRNGLATGTDAKNNKVLDFGSIRKEMSKQMNTEEKATNTIVDWSSMTKDSEINSYKCKITLLERQIDEMNIKNSKTRIDNQVKETKLKSEIESNQKTILRQTEEINCLKENDERLKLEFEKLENHNLEQTNLFEKQQLEYEKLIGELRENLSEIESNASNTRSSLLSENLLQQHQIDELQSEISKLKGENEIHTQNFSQSKLKDVQIEHLRQELDLAKNEITRLTDEIKSYEEGTQLKDILKGEINNYQQIQEENLHLKNQLDLLKESRDENLILHEKIHSLKTQIDVLNKLIEEKNVDMGEVQYNKQRINEWIRIVGADLPDVVVGQIEELKQNISLLRIENDSLKADLQSRNTRESYQDNSFKSLEGDLNEAKLKIEHLSDSLKKLNRKCLLFAKEKESYKNVIHSYESETTVNFEEITQKRILDLQSINSEYKSILDNYEHELKQAREMANCISTKEREIQELKSEIERIKTLNPHIYTNVSLDTTTCLQTSEKNFRVMHFKQNPLTDKIAQYSEEHTNLKEENCRLKCLVEVLESGNVADMTRQINEGIVHRTEGEKLKKKYDNLQKQYNGLKDTFKKISKSFREACFHLTGYKVENIANNRYKLTHAYDTYKRSLYFEVNNNNISLLQESSLASLQDKIDTYLTHGDSYPAFLAAFTLDLYQNRSNNQSLSIMWS